MREHPSPVSKLPILPSIPHLSEEWQLGLRRSGRLLMSAAPFQILPQVHHHRMRRSFLLHHWISLAIECRPEV